MQNSQQGKNNQIKELLAEMEEYAYFNHVPIIKKPAAMILSDITLSLQPQNVLENGTAIGYSTLLLASNSKPDTRIITLEIDEERARTADIFISKSPYRDNIKIITGDAASILDKVGKNFDLVFIDAAKGQYVKYLKLVQPLLNSRGIIAADNVLFRGYVESAEKPPRRYKTIVRRLREYIRLINDETQFVSKIYYEGDGLAVSQKQI